MAYDYSPAFLHQHQETVQQLIQFAETGQLGKYESDDVRLITSIQHRINNILASMARNYPAYADIRRKVRCWKYHDRETGNWILYVGKPDPAVAMPGRPPQPALLTPLERISSQLQTGTVDTFKFQEVIHDNTTFERFAGRVLELPDYYRRATANFALAFDLDYFREIFTSSGWSARSDGLTLILER